MARKQFRITFADGTETVVQPTLEDRLRFETTLRRNRGWGDLKDNALKLEPFLAWSAASRDGYTALTWEQFTTGPTAALDVEQVRDDESAELEVDGLGEGSSPDPSTSSQSYSG